MAGDLKKILKKRLLVCGRLRDPVYMCVEKHLRMTPNSTLTTARSLSHKGFRQCDDSEAQC